MEFIARINLGCVAGPTAQFVAALQGFPSQDAALLVRGRARARAPGRSVVSPAFSSFGLTDLFGCLFEVFLLFNHLRQQERVLLQGQEQQVGHLDPLQLSEVLPGLSGRQEVAGSPDHVAEDAADVRLLLVKRT